VISSRDVAAAHLETAAPGAHWGMFPRIAASGLRPDAIGTTT
jgi:hypothetical protein